MQSDGDGSPSPPDETPSGLLSMLNTEPSRMSGPSLLHDLVRRTSRTDLPAIDYLSSDGTRSTLAYADLHAASDRLARRISRALSPADAVTSFAVPVLLPQSPDLYIAEVAILKAGGAFCPLNLDAPPERVKFIVGDVSAKVLVTISSLADKIPVGIPDLKTIILDDVDANADVPDRPLRTSSPQDSAYIMYTSGSTGTPKGVAISHDAAAQSLLAHDRHIPAFSRFLQFAAPTFDVSVFEIFFPLFRGCTLVCSDRGAMLSDLPAVLREMDVDACELTPTVAGSLLRSRQNAPGLRLLLTIGEMLTEPVIREFGGCPERASILWAMYGPTEAAIHCTLQPALASDSIPGNIGVPLDTVSAFVLEPLDPDHIDPEATVRILPRGKIGELAVGGHQLASGYLNRLEQTAAAFIQTPYGRLYRTGDKARIHGDGTIECLGRISEGQVKLRGQRIELGEIEQAILRTPGCRGAVASVIQGIIVAFCEVDDREVIEDDVAACCRDWLPAFMVPGDIILSKTFPRLPSGKVDRRHLKATYESSRNANLADTGEPEGQLDDIQRRLLELARETLGKRVTLRTVLSATGMESIAAIKFASLLRRTGLDVDAVDVLASRTLADLHSVLQRKCVSENGEEDNRSHNAPTRPKLDLDQVVQAVPILQKHRENVADVLYCTPVQQAMLAETAANPTAYCNWIEVALPDGCSFSAAESWFRDILRQHESLRSGFFMLNGHYMQVIWEDLLQDPIQKVRRLDTRFEIASEEEFLRPLRVQILASKSRPRALIQVHHAAYDGWSWDIILSDLNELARQNRLHPRPHFNLVSDYYNSADFFRGFDVARTFWAEHLVGFQPRPVPPLLPMHSTDNRAISAFRMLDISPSDVSSISKKLECSPQVLFQAGIAWLWGSIIGSDDVVLGTVTSGRTIPVPGIEDIVGPCLTTIPIRTRLDQVRTIRELLSSIHAANRQALPHSTLPLAEIKRAAGVLPGQPLYNVLFVYQESLHSRERGSEQVKELSRQDYLETKLLVEIEPSEADYSCRLTYHLNHFHYAHVQHLLGQFQSILKFVIKSSDTPITSISSSFPEAMLSRYNSTPKTFAGTPDLAKLVEATVLRSPHKPAVCFASYLAEPKALLGTLTYSELNKIANRVARKLQASGVEVGEPVLIVMEKSPLLYASILGILKAGCAYLPLLPSTPLSRAAKIVQQAGAKLCVVDAVSFKILRQIDEVRFLDVETSDMSQFSDSNLNVPADPRRIANIIYTSGSTGVPKGVCVTQLNICSNLDILSRIYPIGDHSRLLQSCSQAFDVSVFEIFFSWFTGMCLCSAVNDVLFEDLEHAIRKLKITHLSMTPTVASLVEPRNVPSVEFLVTSGEPMRTDVASKWTKQLYQGYGPSETTNICSVKKMSAGDVIQHLGWTFENTSAFILVPGSGHLVPLGCMGELCFGGDQVAHGYLNAPHLTAEKFIDHPRCGRLYRSGDLGRMLPDGSLMIVGRLDDQVKLRGQRIELGEINSVVTSSEAISSCVTMLAQRKGQDAQTLVSFYVPRLFEDRRFNGLPIEGKVKATNASTFLQLKSSLPDYMIPSHLIPMTTIPITASGKIDKTKLRDIFESLDPATLEKSAAPIDRVDNHEDWTVDEREIADIIAKSLHVPQTSIGRWTPLASLGLDSLSAISISRKLQEERSCKVTVSAILKSASVAGLAKATQKLAADTISARNTISLLPAEVIDEVIAHCENQGLTVERVLPCMPLQEAMVSSSFGNSTAYLNHMLFRLGKDPEVMRGLWSTVSQRHDILRTCFVSTSNSQHSVVQVIVKNWTLPWRSIDTVVDTFETAVGDHMHTVAENLGSLQPPVSCAVIGANKQNFLSFICHHALFDGIGMSQLLLEIEQLAHGLELHAPPLHGLFLEEALDVPPSADEFWRQHFAGFKPRSLRCNTDAGRTGRSVLISSVKFPLSRVEERLRTLNISLLSLLQASWASTLNLLLRRSDICFGNVVSGRSVAIPGVDKLVAPCFNTIPIRSDLGSFRRNTELLKYFQSLNPSLIQYQFTPLRRIQSLCSNNGARLFDTLLLLQQPPRPLDEGIWALEREDGEMDLPLVSEFVPNPIEDTIEVLLHYDQLYLSRDATSLISDILTCVIDNLLNYPSSYLPSSKSLPPALRDQLQGLSLDVQSNETETEMADHEISREWSRTENDVRSSFARLANVSVSRIGSHMSIYQLGLDSINAVQIATALRKEGYKVKATDVMEHNTCAKLSAYLDKAQPRDGERESYDLKAFLNSVGPSLKQSFRDWTTIENILPCTPLQNGMLTEFVNSGGRHYFNRVTYIVDRHIEPDTFSNAWLLAVEKNPMLRVGFATTDHGDSSFAMIQYLSNTTSLPLTVISSGQRDIFNVDKWFLDIAHDSLQELHRPPWSVVIVNHKTETSVHLAIHHALYDANSLQMVISDVNTALRGQVIPDRTQIAGAIGEIMAHASTSEATSRPYWEREAANLVINSFPTMTPLRESRRNILTRNKTNRIGLSTIHQALKRSGFTMQAAVQAAWTRVLSSYIGEPAVTFGVVLSGRQTHITRDAVFPCITTLPVICKHSSSNRVLLEAQMAYSTELHRHQHIPLTKIQKWLGSPNVRLFDTLIVYQKPDSADTTRSDWRVIEDRASIDYPVSLEIIPNGNALECSATFFDDILPASQADIMLEQFGVILDDLALNPNGNQDDVFSQYPGLFSVLPSEEPELLSRITSLHQFVESSARELTDKPALQFVWSMTGKQPVSTTWTYRQLDEMGNRVANILGPLVSVGDIVAISFDKCPEAHFAILGILKAGCAFLALDPSAPPARKNFILQDSGATVFLTDKQMAANLDFEVEVPIVGLDQEKVMEASAEPPFLSRPVTPVDRAYCLYTSGTTGTPKGCEITHENAVQAMLAFQKLFQDHWDQESKWLQFASYHFDVSVLEQYWTWSVGITLIAAPRDLILEDLSGTISTLNITHIDLTPSLARLLHPDDVPSLCRGVFITGGEQLKQEILDVWGPKSVIWNFYGPTEATIGITTFPRMPRKGRPTNIGIQFPNVGTYVLQPGTEIPVLRGAVGELCAAGKLVGKGYLNRVDLTEEKFPTLSKFGERVYRTGDLVRLLHDGCFEFLGRADDQVKLRGQRLEVGEINHCIKSAVEEIYDVATLVIRNEKQHKDFLVSFVVTGPSPDRRTGLKYVAGPDDDSACEAAKKACQSRLPGYMVPTYVVSISYIPLSPNNKAETRVLKQLFNDLGPDHLMSRLKPADEHAGETAHKIFDVLRAVLGNPADTFTPSTNVIEAGIDSISVLQFARALKQTGLTGGTPATIFSHPVIRDLAHALDLQTSHHGQNQMMEVKQSIDAYAHRYRSLACRVLRTTPGQIDHVAPCTPLQQGMISRSRIDGNESAYFNTFSLSLSDTVSISKLKASWASLVKDNAIFRTQFIRTSEAYVQVALKSHDLHWVEHRAADEEELESFLHTYRDGWLDRNSEHILSPFELLFIKTNNRNVLLLHIFHGVYDANSFELMIEWVVNEYTGQSRHASSVTFLEAMMHGPLRNFDSSKRFWIDHLANVKPIPLGSLAEHTTDYPVKAAHRISFQGLSKTCQTMGVTPQALVQSTWASVLNQYLSEDFILGIIISGRSIDLDDADLVMGPLFNTIPYHYKPSSDDTWASSIRRCHQFNTSVLSFQHVPLRDIQKWCSCGQSLFDVLFSFQRPTTLPPSSTKLWTIADLDPNPDFPLALEATLIGDELELFLASQKGVANEEVLDNLLNKLKDALRSVELDPNDAIVGSSSGEKIMDLSSRLSEDVRSSVENKGHRHFEWTREATLIRRAIALLADVEPETISEHTGLLELGLDSIDTIKLSARLKDYGLVLTNSELIRGQTVSSITDILADKTKEAQFNPQDNLVAPTFERMEASLRKHLQELDFDLGGVESVFPPTPLQDSMVFEMIQSGFTRYFNHDVLELPRDIDINRLKQAWTTVIEGSPILRTGFAQVESPLFDFSYCQVIYKESSVRMQHVESEDRHCIPAIITEATEVARSTAGSANLMQLTFVEAQDERYLILSLAHALYDGWSLNLLHQDVQDAYHGAYSPRASYKGCLSNIILSSTQQARGFWSDYLAGAAASQMPLKSEDDVGERTFRAETSSRVTAQAAAIFCRRHGLSIQVLGQACWSTVLASHCKSLDVSFGVVLSGRETEEEERLLYPTMNTIPVRSILHGDIASFMRYMQENMSNIGQFQHFPLRKILSLQGRRSSDLFNSLFILQRAPDLQNNGVNEPILKSIDGSSAVEYPVCIEMEVLGDAVLWRTACSSRCLSEDEMTHLLHELDVVLSYMVNSSDKEVLSWTESGVSICGLSPFQPKSEAKETVQSDDETVDGGTEQSWSVTEEGIRSVLAQLSGYARTSIHQTHGLYHLGLDSISAIKASSLLRKQGINISVRQMLESGSISRMASFVPQSKALPREVEQKATDTFDLAREIDIDTLLLLGGIEKREVVDILPATPMQDHMISVWQNTEGVVFCPEFRYGLSGISKRNDIDLAWNQLVEEMAILRTTFLPTNSKRAPLVQVIRSQPSELVHLEMAQLDSDRWKLSLRIHHALYDGVSLPLVMERFRQLLAKDHTVASAGGGYSNWKSFTLSSLSEASTRARRDFWTAYLAESQTAHSLFAETAAEDRGRVRYLQRSAMPNISRIASFCSANGLSIQSLFFAAYAKAVSSLSRSTTRDLVFGIYLVNRATEDLEFLPCPTLRIVPLRVQLDSSTPITNLARKVQDDIHRISSPEASSVGLWEIEEWTSVKIDSFVNFLSLPNESFNTSEGLESIQLQELHPQDESVGLPVPPPRLEVNQTLAGNLIRDSYLDSVDVEVAINGDAMDIGVFGPQSRLGNDMAKLLATGIVQSLHHEL